MKSTLLKQELENYDQDFYQKLEPVLEEIALKSKALASNLKDCIERLKISDRYWRAYQGENISIKEADLSGEEFEIFRKYVRLLRSCTIMCGQESSFKFKTLFMDFFAGTRLELAQGLGKINKNLNE